MKLGKTTISHKDGNWLFDSYRYSAGAPSFWVALKHYIGLLLSGQEK